MDGSLGCGQVAKLSGVSADTIRHYERIGVLPPALRSPSGYRLYHSETAERVRLIRRALKLGFSLNELAEILKIRDQGGTPCRRVLSLTEAKLRSLELQIKDLRQAQKYMKQLVQQWRGKLAQTKRGSKAMLLESLGAHSMKSVSAAKDFRRRKQS